MLEALKDSLSNQLAIGSTDLAAKVEVEDCAKYPEVLLFQTGYLTIKEYEGSSGIYRLGFPNNEVRTSFTDQLLPYVVEKSPAVLRGIKTSMHSALAHGNPVQFLNDLRVLLAGIPFQIHAKNEGYYHTIVLLTTQFIGFESTAELQTNRGSIDLVVQTPSYIYVMEFKIDKPSKVALEQIMKKDYFRKFAHGHRKIYVMGISFDTERRDLREDWDIQEIKK